MIQFSPTKHNDLQFIIFDKRDQKELPIDEDMFKAGVAAGLRDLAQQQQPRGEKLNPLPPTEPDLTGFRKAGRQNERAAIERDGYDPLNSDEEG